jgi:hypothetical protein
MYDDVEHIYWSTFYRIYLYLLIIKYHAFSTNKIFIKKYLKIMFLGKLQFMQKNLQKKLELIRVFLFFFQGCNYVYITFSFYEPIKD